MTKFMGLNLPGKYFPNIFCTDRKKETGKEWGVRMRERLKRSMPPPQARHPERAKAASERGERTQMYKGRCALHRTCAHTFFHSLSFR